MSLKTMVANALASAARWLGSEPVEEPLSAPERMGDVYQIDCDLVETDWLGIRAGGHPVVGRSVAVVVKAGEMFPPRTVLLRPNNARRAGAALLNAADEADGTQPLLFMPAPAVGADPDLPEPPAGAVS